MPGIDVYFLCYGVLAISHILVQTLFGHLEHKRQQNATRCTGRYEVVPSVSAVVPAYNEDPEILCDCIRSLAFQTYPSIEVIVVDDGSPDRERLERDVYRNFDGMPNVRIIYSDGNHGKRHAQTIGFKEATGSIIVTVDSDTIVPDGAIRRIIRRFSEPHVAAVTGDVRVENRNRNILTRLIAYRYWSAFHQERAAQSFFRVLMCCSGPFSAYRREVIQEVQDRYACQEFLGHICTYGDDRHLTNLVLEGGHRVVFDGDAEAYTHVPETLPTYLKQQVRWNKSFYREMLWTMKSFRKHNLYLIYDLVLQFALPFLLLIALSGLTVHAITHGVGVILHYTLTIVGIAVLRAGYGLFRTRDPGFLLFVLYGFIHLALLLPARFYALFTMRETGWGTR